MPFLFTPESYDELLSQKIGKVEQLFDGLNIPNLPEIDTHASPKTHYRMRAEFRIWQDGEHCYPVMFNKETKQAEKITCFPIANQIIDELIQSFESWANASEIIRKRLFQIEMLSAKSREVVLTLIYHKKLDENWETQAKELAQHLSTKHNTQVHIVGRSRKQKVVLSQDYITETFTVANKEINYKQIEGSFTQPNATMNEGMLNWVVSNSSELNGDALELYCGNGNFTLALAQKFERVFATEVVKSAVYCAQENVEKNQIDNITIARLSSEEFTQAMNGEREFRRLKDIDLSSYKFSTILVDPPRSGLDAETCKMIQQFENIIYISCNPNTLVENLKTLCQSHQITQRACFDQFPYTDHLECGVILQKLK